MDETIKIKKKRVRTKEFNEYQKLRSREYYAKNKKIILEKEKIKNKEIRKNNPDKIRETKRRIYIKTTYGITLDDYNNMLKEQNFKCKICNREHEESPPNRRLHIDHCHRTGRVRALLCQHCNNGIGSFKDDISIINKAISYLNFYSK